MAICRRMVDDGYSEAILCSMQIMFFFLFVKLNCKIMAPAITYKFIFICCFCIYLSIYLSVLKFIFIYISVCKVKYSIVKYDDKTHLEGE